MRKAWEVPHFGERGPDAKAASSDKSDEAAWYVECQRYLCATIAPTATGIGSTDTSPTGVDTDAEIDVRPRRRPWTRPSAVTRATDVSLDA